MTERTERTERPRDPNGFVASLAQRGLALELQTVDLCFLAALWFRADRGGFASFEEQQLVDAFEQVARVLEPDAEQPAKRATPAIRRLREQRMLARVDGAGVVRAGEYALTRLATGIVEFFLEDETLTKDSLVLLTHTLRSSLLEVRAAARAASAGEADWRAGVVGPLRVTVLDLVSGIGRRQCGFDVQQEEFQREIAELLSADWFGAVERCQSMLDVTSTTLRELNQVLLRDTHELLAILHDIQELAAASAERALPGGSAVAEAEEASRAVMDQVDRIAAWGSARQRAWSEYYQYVHRYLRDIVRLDPSRMLTQRLREQLAGTGPRFSLAIAGAPPMRVLRDVVAPPSEKPPVRRPKKERDVSLPVAPEIDPQAKLEGDVKQALASGARGLAQVTTQVTREMADPERYAAAGRIAHVVAKLAKADARAERPWIDLDGGMSIEEWRVTGEREAS